VTKTTNSLQDTCIGATQSGILGTPILCCYLQSK